MIVTGILLDRYEKDIYDWVNENMGPQRGRLLTTEVNIDCVSIAQCQIKIYQKKFCFTSEADLMAFKLKWE